MIRLTGVNKARGGTHPTRSFASGQDDGGRSRYRTKADSGHYNDDPPTEAEMAGTRIAVQLSMCNWEAAHEIVSQFQRDAETSEGEVDPMEVAIANLDFRDPKMHASIGISHGQRIANYLEAIGVFTVGDLMRVEQQQLDQICGWGAGQQHRLSQALSRLGVDWEHGEMPMTKCSVCGREFMKRGKRASSVCGLANCAAEAMRRGAESARKANTAKAELRNKERLTREAAEERRMIEKMDRIQRRIDKLRL